MVGRGLVGARLAQVRWRWWQVVVAGREVRVVGGGEEGAVVGKVGRRLLVEGGRGCGEEWAVWVVDWQGKGGKARAGFGVVVVLERRQLVVFLAGSGIVWCFPVQG